MAGVHGNELAGIYALQSIISDVQITAGKVFIIFANLKALEQETREYENNMNRCFFKNIF
jgi:succinylglutamate desuccinylase